MWRFDEGLASRVPYESSARTLSQSKETFSGYTVRQGKARNVCAAAGARVLHAFLRVGAYRNTNAPARRSRDHARAQLYDERGGDKEL